MQVIIRPTPEEATRLVAREVEKAVRAKPSIVLGLATGSTMERLYARLVRMHATAGLDFSLVRTFNLDEYVGLKASDPHSYHAYMQRHLFRHINADPRNTHLLDGMARDLAAECRRYEELIAACGGIDLQLLGIGRDGHIGFNEPLSALSSRTRDKSLAPATLAQNARYFAHVRQMPRRALTMGVGTILACQRLFLVATGREKAAVIARAVEGPVTSMVTASAIQLHPHCTVVLDEGAAAELQARADYDWFFANEPYWAEYRTRVSAPRRRRTRSRS